MDLSTMRGLVRRDLRDEDADNYLWTDDEIDRHISHAVYDLSEQIPHNTTSTLSTVADSLDLDISSLADLINLVAVEYPLDYTPKRFQPFTVWGDVLTFTGSLIPDGEDCKVYYGELHTLDGDGCTVPTKLHSILAIGAAGYAMVSWGGYSINRVNVGGLEVPEHYKEQGDRALTFFYREIKRLGRRHHAVVSRLYTPSEPIVGKDVEYGP